MTCSSKLNAKYLYRCCESNKLNACDHHKTMNYKVVPLLHDPFQIGCFRLVAYVEKGATRCLSLLFVHDVCSERVPAAVPSHFTQAHLSSFLLYSDQLITLLCTQHSSWEHVQKFRQLELTGLIFPMHPLWHCPLPCRHAILSVIECRKLVTIEALFASAKPECFASPVVRLRCSILVRPGDSTAA